MGTEHQKNDESSWMTSWLKEALDNLLEFIEFLQIIAFCKSVQVRFMLDLS